MKFLLPLLLLFPSETAALECDRAHLFQDMLLFYLPEQEAPGTTYPFNLESSEAGAKEYAYEFEFEAGKDVFDWGTSYTKSSDPNLIEMAEPLNHLLGWGGTRSVQRNNDWRNSFDSFFQCTPQVVLKLIRYHRDACGAGVVLQVPELVAALRANRTPEFRYAIKGTLQTPSKGTILIKQWDSESGRARTCESEERRRFGRGRSSRTHDTNSGATEAYASTRKASPGSEGGPATRRNSASPGSNYSKRLEVQGQAGRASAPSSNRTYPPLPENPTGVLLARDEKDFQRLKEAYLRRFPEMVETRFIPLWGTRSVLKNLNWALGRNPDGIGFSKALPRNPSIEKALRRANGLEIRLLDEKD